MNGIVKEIHGRYYVDSSYNMSDKPMLMTHRYPVRAAQGRIDIDKPNVQFRSGQGGLWLGLGYEVYTDDASEMFQTPIPAPKTKLETRWHYERWEKYSKSQGWITA